MQPHKIIRFWLFYALILASSTQVCVADESIKKNENSIIIQAGEISIEHATGKSVTMNQDLDGQIEAGKIVFTKLLPGEGYDLSLTKKSGDFIHLLDCAWYTGEPADPKADPLSDDDRESIRAIVQDIKAFTNKNTILQLTGDGSRAVGIVELIRDTDFYSGKTGEIIWRLEVWYFENQAGGWAKVQQQNRVIERKLFKSSEEFEKWKKNHSYIGLAIQLRAAKGLVQTIQLPTVLQPTNSMHKSSPATHPSGQ